MFKSTCALWGPFHIWFMSFCSKSFTDIHCSYWKNNDSTYHNFAHAMTTKLSWHVQNCDMIQSLESISLYIYIYINSQDFNHELPSTFMKWAHDGLGSLCVRASAGTTHVWSYIFMEQHFKCLSITNRTGYILNTHLTECIQPFTNSTGSFTIHAEDNEQSCKMMIIRWYNMI